MIVLVGCTNDTTTVETPEKMIESQIEVTPMSFDFGDIDRKNGKVSTTVIVENLEGTPIIINRLSTSCGCTTAEMDMSELAPGETRAMKITFDPMTHPDLTGQIMRVVYLQTSDKARPEIEIELTGNVI